MEDFIRARLESMIEQIAKLEKRTEEEKRVTLGIFTKQLKRTCELDLQKKTGYLSEKFVQVEQKEKKTWTGNKCDHVSKPKRESWRRKKLSKVKRVKIEGTGEQVGKILSS